MQRPDAGKLSQMADESDYSIVSISAVPFVTLLAGTLAIIFDVGYFEALGPNFFSIFSLSDHLNFAMHAIPKALAMVAAFAVVLGFASRFQPLLENRLLFALSILVIIVLFSLHGINLSDQEASHPPDFRRKLLSLKWLCFLVAGPIFVAGLVVPQFHSRLAAGIAAGATSLVFLALGFGLAEGEAVLNEERPPPYEIETKDWGAVRGVFLRSGEQGLLIFDPSPTKKHLQFLRWDQLKAIYRASRKAG
jgi:hypothetical protein